MHRLCDVRRTLQGKIFCQYLKEFHWNVTYLPGSGACVAAIVGCVVSVNMHMINDIKKVLIRQTSFANVY